MNKQFLKAGMLGLLVAGWLSQSVWAQSDPTGKRRVTSTYAITNATVFKSPSDPGSKATILIKDGIIVGVGTSLTLPKEAKLIAGDSLFAYPGFIAGAGTMGISKPKDAERPKDFVSSNPPDEIAGITPWRAAADFYTASSSQVEDWRKAGFTISQVIPDGGMLPGKTAILVLGDSKTNNFLNNNAAVAANFRSSRSMYPATLAGVMAKFRDVYQNTALVLDHERMFATTTGVKRPQVSPTQEAMKAVVQKQQAVLFTAGSELEIRRAIALQKELGFKLILTGLENYESVIDLIKSSGTPVLIKLQLPDEKSIKAQKSEGVTEATKAQYARVKEAYDAALKQAALLEKAGILFGFSTADAKASEVHQTLKTMIDNGLSEKAALAALTTNPATILGISKVAGTLEKGMLANLILSTDTLFKEETQIKHVIADGYVFDYEIKKKSQKTDTSAVKSENPSNAISVEGVWEYTSETPAGSSGGEITIKRDNGVLGGTITYDDPSGSGKASAPIKNASLTGKTLSFEFEVSAGGMSLSVLISGEINGKSMDGALSVPQMGSFPVKATLTSPNLAN
ncbi:MAG: amidohydrolase family protein [Algoriphagus sp.]|jgi:imidazolonepropionase-like amidohydrolase|uniref:amidohydrolase family protein n=1 Tax=Algoriphagus sp. TaxID=1872435 RepID=UPI00275D4A94|nr:amidohydrolase family protein [Algoriphagus sp.]MDP4747447.1 amidohydrolase family protein [Algoriphagus sp.]MDP4839724.1 amidohydrolase family protein [Algoriphagus sp.]MDP4904302.1 amidohydrolase family protein [Algoriphagus sp.]MDP4957583.1 amidohydrolase family protein [Algoriphagus sp.]